MLKSDRFPVRSLIGGGATLLVGVLATIESLRYPLGTIGQIGPGVFPLGLSLLLCAAGVAIILEDLRTGAVPEPSVPLHGLLAIVGGLAAFALLIAPFGIVPAVIASVVISARADASLRLGPTLVLAAGLAIGCLLVFVIVLNLPIAPIRWPL